MSIDDRADRVQARIENQESGFRALVEREQLEIGRLKARAAQVLDVSDLSDLEAVRKQIQVLKKRAIEILAIQDFSELDKVRLQIQDLKKSGGELNLASMRRFVGWSWWVMLSTSAAALGMAIVAFWKIRKLDTL